MLSRYQVSVYRTNGPLVIILIPTPDFPNFYYMLGGNSRSLLYGDVSVMNCMNLVVCRLLHYAYIPSYTIY